MPNVPYVSFRLLHWLASQDQLVSCGLLPNENLESANQILDPLVRNDSPEEQDRLVAFPQPQALLRLLGRKVRVGKGIVYRIGNDGDRSGRDAEVLTELALHLVGVDKDVVAQPVLDSQRNAVQPGIPRIPSRPVHIVRSKDHFL